MQGGVVGLFDRSVHGRAALHAHAVPHLGDASVRGGVGGSVKFKLAKDGPRQSDLQRHLADPSKTSLDAKPPSLSAMPRYTMTGKTGSHRYMAPVRASTHAPCVMHDICICIEPRVMACTRA